MWDRGIGDLTAMVRLLAEVELAQGAARKEAWEEGSGLEHDDETNSDHEDNEFTAVSAQEDDHALHQYILEWRVFRFSPNR